MDHEKWYARNGLQEMDCKKWTARNGALKFEVKLLNVKTTLCLSGKMTPIYNRHLIWNPQMGLPSIVSTVLAFSGFSGFGALGAFCPGFNSGFRS